MQPRTQNAPATTTKRPGRPRWHPAVPPRDPRLPSLQAILKRRAAAACSLIALAALLFQPRDGFAGVPPGPLDAQGGSLMFRTADSWTPAALVDTDVSITVSGLVAHVSVMQQFRNTGDGWVEGIYVFPLPDAAAVNRMRLYIGDRFIEGEIREKEQARQEYEQARRAGQKTSLVEQQRANLFTTAVANVAPGETVIVEIEYLEELRFDSGMFSLRFPMTVTPRYFPGGAGTVDAAPGPGPAPGDAALLAPPLAELPDGQQVSLRATIDAGMPLDIVASRYHPVHVGVAGGSYGITLAEARVPMNQDFELLWRPAPSSVPRAMAFAETAAGDSHYLLLVVPPDNADSALPVVPRDIVFVIDTSGSMHGVSLVQAKQALRRALATLQPGDRFNVIEFNSIAVSLFPASVPADAVNVERASAFVARLSADGGTEMQLALELALQPPATSSHLRQVVFITDGAVGNEDELFAQIENSLGEARLFTVGIGPAPNGWFMRKAAESGRGAFTFIGDVHEVGEKMDRLFRKLGSPAVTGIEVLWPGGTAAETFPATVPDLYRGEPVALRVRLAGAPRPGDRVTVAGSTVGGSWSAEVELAGRGNAPGIAALWARAKIADLLDTERRGADPAATRAAIVDTALAHHLVSKYTSLVAVDRTPQRPGGEPLASERLANRAGRGQANVMLAGLAPTATAAPVLRHSGAMAIALALLLIAAPALGRSLSRVRAA